MIKVRILDGTSSYATLEDTRRFCQPGAGLRTRAATVRSAGATFVLGSAKLGPPAKNAAFVQLARGLRLGAAGKGGPFTLQVQMSSHPMSSSLPIHRRKAALCPRQIGRWAAWRCIHTRHAAPFLDAGKWA